MLEIYAQQSEAARAAATASWRALYLGSVLRCLKSRKRDHIKAAIMTAKAYRRVRLTGTIVAFDDETEVGNLFRKRLHGMILGTSGAWANFLVADVGLGDPELETFKVLSPFKGCLLLLNRSGKDQVIRGELSAFRALFANSKAVTFTQVHRQEFRPQGERRHHYILQVLRPDVIPISSSVAPPAPRESDPTFLRQSQVGELFGSMVPSAPPPAPAATEDTRKAVVPSPPTNDT